MARRRSQEVTGEMTWTPRPERRGHRAPTRTMVRHDVDDLVIALNRTELVVLLELLRQRLERGHDPVAARLIERIMHVR